MTHAVPSSLHTKRLGRAVPCLRTCSPGSTRVLCSRWPTQPSRRPCTQDPCLPCPPQPRACVLASPKHQSPMSPIRISFLVLCVWRHNSPRCCAIHVRTYAVWACAARRASNCRLARVSTCTNTSPLPCCSCRVKVRGVRPCPPCFVRPPNPLSLSLWLRAHGRLGAATARRAAVGGRGAHVAADLGTWLAHAVAVPQPPQRHAHAGAQCTTTRWSQLEHAGPKAADCARVAVCLSPRRPMCRPTEQMRAPAIGNAHSEAMCRQFVGHAQVHEGDCGWAFEKNWWH